MRYIASIVVLVLFMTIGCKKKEDTPTPTAPPSNNPNPPASSYKKLKTTRSVSNYTPTGTIDISDVTLIYDATSGRVSSANVLDSSYNGSVWSVSTFTMIYNYNSSVQLTSIFYQMSAGTFTNAMVYDTNNKLQMEILSGPSSANDTTYYSYVTNGMRLRRNASGFYNIDYYNSDNLDSTVAYDSNTHQCTGFRDKRTYNQTIDLTSAYLNQYYPVSFFGSKYTETTYQGGGSAPLITYAYLYDSQNYPIRRGELGGGPTNTSIYYSYY